MRRLLFWLPLLLWIAVEIHLLQVALSVSCVQAGGNRYEVFMALAFWGFPSSMLASLLADAFSMGQCSTLGCVSVWTLYCAAGFLQWYFVLSGAVMRGNKTAPATPFNWNVSPRIGAQGCGIEAPSHYISADNDK